jgi:hypothetical protein
MKNFFLLLTFILTATLLSAQNAQYTAAMTKAVTALDSAKTPTDFQAAANTFSRIAAAEPAEWLPLYYAAFGHLNTAFPMFEQDPAKATLILDLAQASLDKAKTLAPQESELAVMQAYILIGRLMENPMAKGAEITPQVFGELGKAAALNPENPRAAFLHGTYVLNMPAFYGGGAANAKPHFEKAAALFEKESDRGLLPHWGEKANVYFLEKVNQPEKGN